MITAKGRDVENGGFEGGVTLRERVLMGERAVLSKCSGYRADDGSLVPEKLAAPYVATPPVAGDLPFPEQTPVAFRDSSGVRIIARDKNEKIRELSGTLAAATWSAAGDTIDVVPESLPCKLGVDQIIFATKGASPQLKVYEPNSATTKTRPLAFKGPLDYSASEKPTVTQSASAELQLFDCNDAETDWVAVEEGVTPTTTDDAVVIVIDSTSDANSVLAKKDLGATGIDPSGKSFFVFDIAIENDEQDYTYAGLFPNDPLIAPSGYIFEFYDDQACSSLIQSYYIPKCTQQGLVYRFAINIGTLTTTIKGVAIRTAGFWTPPASGTFTIRLWSEAFQDNWTHKGNFLLPAVQWDKGAWAEILSGTGTVSTGYLDVPPTGNVLSKGDFEDSFAWGTDWCRSNATEITRQTYAARSGTYGAHINRSSSVERYITSGSTAGAGSTIDKSREYYIELYYRTYEPATSIDFTVEVVEHDAAHGVVEQHLFPSSGSYSSDSTSFRRLRGLFTSSSDPAVTHCHVIITAKPGNTGDDLHIDDVNLYPANQASSNCSYLLQTLSQSGGNRSPDNPLVQYAYCHFGKDRLSVDLYNAMVSNPSLASSPSTFADPWRTNTVDIAAGVPALAIAEYGDYLTDFLFYRRIYDGTTQAWGTWGFIGSDGIDTTGQWLDDGTDDWETAEVGPTIDDVVVPLVMETNNDYLASALHVLYRERRTKAFTLNWDNDNSKWGYSLGVAISSDGKPWAFPTGLSQELLSTDGKWDEVEALTAYEIRGVLPVTDDDYVFLDNEFFVMRGDNPESGWRYIRPPDAVGLASARSLADCRGMPIGFGIDGYFYAFVPGSVTPLSKYTIDGDKIDLTKPHNAVFCSDRYIFYCTYDSLQALIIYNLTTGAWTIRYIDVTTEIITATHGTLVGICTDGEVVYGLTTLGYVFDMFNSTSISATREISFAYTRVSPVSQDVQTQGMVFNIETDQLTDSLSVMMMAKGKSEESAETQTLKIHTKKNAYNLTRGILAEHVACDIVYSGTTPPTFHMIGFDHDKGTAR